MSLPYINKFEYSICDNTIKIELYHFPLIFDGKRFNSAVFDSKYQIALIRFDITTFISNELVKKSFIIPYVYHRQGTFEYHDNLWHPFSIASISRDTLQRTYLSSFQGENSLLPIDNFMYTNYSGIIDGFYCTNDHQDQYVCEHTDPNNPDLDYHILLTKSLNFNEKFIFPTMGSNNCLLNKIKSYGNFIFWIAGVLILSNRYNPNNLDQSDPDYYHHKLYFELEKLFMIQGTSIADYQPEKNLLLPSISMKSSIIVNTGADLNSLLLENGVVFPATEDLEIQSHPINEAYKIQMKILDLLANFHYSSSEENLRRFNELMSISQ